MKTPSGSVFKSELMPEKTFFTMEQLQEFTKGTKYKRLLHDMRKGMRTFNDNERLKKKAEARRERQEGRRAEQRREKVRKRRTVGDGDADEIERRKAKFQEKKARRLAKKAEAAA